MTNADQLRALTARLQNFADRRSALIAERERLVTQADQALDDRSISRLAALEAGIALARTVEARLLSQARVAPSAIQDVDQRIRNLGGEIVSALRVKLLAKAGPWHPGKPRVEESEEYRQEVELVQAVYPTKRTPTPSPPGYGQELDVTLANLRESLLPQLVLAAEAEDRLRKLLAERAPDRRHAHPTPAFISLFNTSGA